VRPYLRERDTVTNLEFDAKDVTDEEELLQAESEHDGTEEHTSSVVTNKIKKSYFLGTRRRYEPETVSAVVMKYLVESDKD
jgi:hypothetical protein